MERVGFGNATWHEAVTKEACIEALGRGNPQGRCSVESRACKIQNDGVKTQESTPVASYKSFPGAMIGWVCLKPHLDKNAS